MTLFKWIVDVFRSKPEPPKKEPRKDGIAKQHVINDGFFIMFGMVYLGFDYLPFDRETPFIITMSQYGLRHLVPSTIPDDFFYGYEDDHFLMIMSTYSNRLKKEDANWVPISWGMQSNYPFSSSLERLMFERFCDTPDLDEWLTEGDYPRNQWGGVLHCSEWNEGQQMEFVIRWS